MLRRLAVLVSISTFTLVVPAPGAQSLVWSGSCTLQLTFDFSSRIRSASSLVLTNPSYSISVSPVDLDPLAGGTQGCLTSPTGLLTTTNAWGGGSSLLWTCEGTLANGSWNQNWGSGPPHVAGSHLITGSGGSWTMEIHQLTGPTFVGTMELTVHPLSALSYANCPSAGVRSITMIGVLVFQDP